MRKLISREPLDIVEACPSPGSRSLSARLQPNSETMYANRMTRMVSLMMAIGSAASFAASSSAIGAIDFVRDVRPILQKHCYACHSAEKEKSGLRLDVKALAFKGGSGHGPAIVPGNADESPIFLLASGAEPEQKMPPKGQGLSDSEVETLKTWIDAGAVWPDGIDTAKVADRRDHWSFKPLTHPALPEVKRSDWPRGPIDRFILARLEREGLAPSPAADRRAWLRRVSIDLTGLLPTVEEVDAFLADDRPGAFERVVERLLASPRYGERWAQHWLDVVRYADTHGFEVNTERPNAWPYRDYVIAAINADTPYDRFVREQIAGDQLGKDAATGFLVTAAALLPGQIGADDASKRLARQDELSEIIVNTGQTFLGLTIGCARCHDHKFDPISARDYYALQGFFAGVDYGDRPMPSREGAAARRVIEARLRSIETELAQFVPLAKSGARRVKVSARENVERFAPVQASRVRLTIRKTNNLEPCVDELEVYATTGKNVALASAGGKPSASGSNVSPNRHELRLVNDGEYGNSSSWMSSAMGGGWVQIDLPGTFTIDRVVWGRDRKGEYGDRLATDYVLEVATGDGPWQAVADASDREPFEAKPAKMQFAFDHLPPDRRAEAEKLVREKRDLEKILGSYAAEGALVFAGVFRTPDNVKLLARGDPEQPKDSVAPAVPELFGKISLAADAPEPRRRQALAEWLTDPGNPLVARVAVNRIWQWHFSTGLVDTPNDFGHSGSKPSHPELLDWLAGEFVRSGWSMKHMHRLIVLSATYGQSATIDPKARAIDADTRLLWRYPPRRMEAEAIRDNTLAVAGSLNTKMGGRGYDLFGSRGGLNGFPPIEKFGEEGRRRLIYAHKVRMERDIVFGAFDCPDAGQSQAMRKQSTTPIQALNLFNSQFTVDQAEAFAARVIRESGEDPARNIDHAFLLAYSRHATPGEIAEMRPFVQEYGLPVLCRAILNSNEFLFIP